MKVIFISIILFLIFSASQCNKNSENCNRIINIINNSDSSVIYSTILYDGQNPSQCILTKNAVIESNENFEEYSKNCWEDKLEYLDFEFFIVDPTHFNEGIFYNCDSIEFKNRILKHYILTRDDINTLKQNNFKIVYQ